MATMALNTAATGLRALSTQLDVISNNIANANNDGFKASRANFEDLFYQYYQDPGVQDEAGNTRPIGLAVGLGTRISGTQLDMSQGSAVTTGRPPLGGCPHPPVGSHQSHAGARRLPAPMFLPSSDQQHREEP